jgi:microcystin degradation protein MlrC
MADTPGAEIIIVDAPGQYPSDISVFEYRFAPQDIYPIKDR